MEEVKAVRELTKKAKGDKEIKGEKARARCGGVVKWRPPHSGAEPSEGSPAPEGTPSDVAPDPSAETPPDAVLSRERELGPLVHWMDEMPSPALDALG